MLIAGFYTILEFEPGEKKLKAKLALNPEHELYKGHFPGQPVVPGVMQLQIIKELLEKALNQNLFLGEMAFSKFLKLIVPQNSPELIISIDFNPAGNKIPFSAKIEDTENVFTKVKGVFSLLS